LFFKLKRLEAECIQKRDCRFQKALQGRFRALQGFLMKKSA
jgi:hypothetical protein